MFVLQVVLSHMDWMLLEYATAALYFGWFSFPKLKMSTPRSSSPEIAMLVKLLLFLLHPLQALNT